MSAILLLNYSHPLDDAQRERAAALLGAAVAVRDIPVQIDQAAPLEPQVAALADAAGLSGAQWQRAALLVNPPGLASVAALLIAEIHGRSGHFPALLHIRPTAGPITGYEVGALIDLQQLRDRARARRTAGDQ